MKNNIDPTDSALVTDVKNRIEQGHPSFEKLYNKYNPRLYKMVFRISNNHHDTLDILQETWSKFLVIVEVRELENYFGAWIFSVAKHFTINYLRLRETRSGTVPYDRNTFVWEDFSAQMEIDNQKDSPQVPEELMTMIDPSERTHWDIILNRVNEYIQSLSPRNRILIEKAVAGDSMKEIANELNMKIGTVGFTLHNIRKKLWDLRLD